MQSTLVLLVKVGLLVVLWLFIWVTVRAMNRDVARATTSAPAPVHRATVGAATAGPGRQSRGFSRGTAPRSLILATGPLTGTTLALTGYDEVTIGRSKSCTLVLEDDFASGTHARLIRTGPDWNLEDLDSRNGTFLDGQRIDQPEPLHVNDEFRVGQTIVRMDS